MRRITQAWAVGLLGGAGLVGCENAKPYNTDVPMVEEFVSPPNEDRFDHAREERYTRPEPKKEFKPTAGGGGMPGAGGGMPGGGPGRGGF